MRENVIHQKGGFQVPWTVLGGSFLLAFAMWAPMFCVPPMVHILKEELFLTHAQTSLLFTIPMLMIAAVAIPGGFLADRIGVRRAAGIGAIIMAVGTMLRGTATNASSLLAFTFVYGVGLGLSFPNLPKLVSTWFPREKAGVATGIFSSGLPTGAAVALAITMPLVFPITNTFQGVFFIWGIPPTVAAILWWIMVRKPPHDGIQDKALSIGITPFRQLLRNKGLWLISSLFLLHNFFFYTWAGWAPTLMRLRGATPETAGLISSLVLWASIPTALFMPRLSYRLGIRKPFLWVPSIALALASWGGIHVHLPMIWSLMTLVGIASATRFPTIMALPVETMPEKDVGTVSGLIISLGFIGGVIGPLIGGHILDLSGSLDRSLLVLIGVSVVATVIAFRLPETGSKATSKKTTKPQ